MERWVAEEVGEHMNTCGKQIKLHLHSADNNWQFAELYRRGYKINCCRLCIGRSKHDDKTLQCLNSDKHWLLPCRTGESLIPQKAPTTFSLKSEICSADLSLVPWGSLDRCHLLPPFQMDDDVYVGPWWSIFKGEQSSQNKTRRRKLVYVMILLWLYPPQIHI